MEYNIVPVKGLKYSNFKQLGKKHSFTGDFGVAYPIYAKECVAGDVLRLGVANVTDFLPMISPLHADVYFNTFAAFVPARLYDERFPKFLKGLNADDSEYSTPRKSIQDVYAQWSDLGEDVEDRYDNIVHDLYDFCIQRGLENTVNVYYTTTISQSLKDANMIDISDPHLPKSQQLVVDSVRKLFSSYENFKEFFYSTFVGNAAKLACLKLLPFVYGNLFDHLGYPTLDLIFEQYFRVGITCNAISAQGVPVLNATTALLYMWDTPSYSDQTWYDVTLLDYIHINYNGRVYSISQFLNAFTSDYILPDRFFAYWYFYDDWFAHPDFDDPLGCRWLWSNEVGVPNDEFELMEGKRVRISFVPFNILWEKDYFTSCLKNAQRGTPPALPISITGGVSGLEASTVLSGGSVSSDIDFTDSVYTGYDLHSDDQGYLRVDTNNSIHQLAVSDVNGDINDQNLASDLLSALNRADVSSVFTPPTATTTITGNVASLDLVSFDISDFRYANALQRFAELNNIAGRRWTDFLKIQYGTSPRDDVLERPDYFGRNQVPVNFGKILSTVGTEQSPLGSFAGVANEAGIDQFRDYNPREPGIVIIIACFSVKTGYMSQGIPREMLRKTRFDYYNSLFAGIGDQEVFTRELFNDYASEDPDNPSILGFEGRFDEYRIDHDDVSGFLRSGAYQTFVLNRKFGSAPSLNSQFVHMHIDKTRFLAVPSDPTFVCHAHIINRSSRPIPERSIPNLGL